MARSGSEWVVAMTSTLEPINLKHHYKPRGSALALMKSKDGEILLSGPAGTGKSRACLEKLLMLALHNPGMRGLIVRKTATSLTSSGLVTWREKVATELIRAGAVVWYGGSQQEQAGYRFHNGSFLAVGGMDKPSKIMSTEYDAIYVQEAIELTAADWEAITSRLRNGVISFQQLMADTNPDRPTHWLKQRANEGKVNLIEARHEDNPLYFDELGKMTERGKAYIEGKLDRLSGLRKQRLRHGLWVAADGLVFDQFDPFIHVVPRFKPPREWTRYWTVDFGFTNPFVLQCWAADPDGRLFMYREIYHTRRRVDEHARKILDYVAPKGKWSEPRPELIICDHDAEDRATLEHVLEMSTVPARKSVTSGIQGVNERLAAAGDEKPRLFLMADVRIERDEELAEAKKPTCTVEEVTGYVWDERKDSPVKLDDHGCDCIRYTVAELDGGVRPNIRWLE